MNKDLKVGDIVFFKKFGKGKVVYTNTGAYETSVLVSFDKRNSRLHDGNGYCPNPVTNGYYFRNKQKNLKLLYRRSKCIDEIEELLNN